MGTQILALFGWTVAGWIFFLLATMVGIVIAALTWNATHYKDKWVGAGCVFAVAGMGVVGVLIANLNANQQAKKQQDRVQAQMEIDRVAAETTEAESDLAHQGFDHGYYLPVNISVQNHFASFYWPNCSFILGLEKINDRYAVTLFQTLTPRPLRPDEIHTLIQLGCEQP